MIHLKHEKNCIHKEKEVGFEVVKYIWFIKQIIKSRRKYENKKMNY